MDKLERELRASPTCAGCGCAKEADPEFGLVVCWGCFGHRRDITPLKYFNGDLAAWLRTVPQNFPSIVKGSST